MRWIASIHNPDSDLKRLMIYESSDGAFLFGYKRAEDSSADWDTWHESVAEIKSMCVEEHDIQESDWQQIPDPLPHCQHDWIAPVRIKGRDIGKPEWGQMEELVDGIWKAKK